MKVIIDANNLVLGRMASHAAKLALNGDEVVILNVEKAVISGSRKSVIEKFKRKLETRTLASQRKGPKHPRRPDTYVRRVIRGMLPWKKPKGTEAFRRVKVYMGVPDEFVGKQTEKVASADSSKLRCRFITVESLAKEVGG